MARATHKGTCQCCGSIQKLPNGVLSSHGYRVLWNSFVGVCEGTGYLPYEKSCQLIETFIGRAQAQKESLRTFQKDLRVKPTTAVAWYYEYISDPYRKSGYRWQQVELRHSEKSERWIEYRTHEGKWRKHDLYKYGWKDIFEYAQFMNEERIEALEKDIKAIDQYIAWQTERIKNWKPSELIPIK